MLLQDVIMFSLHAGNFPWIAPVLRYLASHSKQAESREKLRSVASELVKARRESGKKV